MLLIMKQLVHRSCNTAAPTTAKISMCESCQKLGCK